MKITPPSPQASGKEIFTWLHNAFGAEAMSRYGKFWALRIRDHRDNVLQVCRELVTRLDRTDVAPLHNPGAWANQTYQAICNGEARPR